MGDHLLEGEFQSDKYPWCLPGFVPLKLTDKTAQPLLRLYADRRKPVDAEFSEDLIEALRLKGHTGEPELIALGELLDNTEEKAWKALRHGCFMEFAHYAELWASLHRISGEKRKNPFSRLAAAARKK